MDYKNKWTINWSDKSFEELKKVTEYVKFYDDYSYLCSTHIDMLNDAITIAKVKNVIEFGGGYWSTSLLLNKCETVLTIEQGQNVPKEQNDSWAEKLKNIYHNNPKWNFIKSAGHHMSGRHWSLTHVIWSLLMDILVQGMKYCNTLLIIIVR